MTSCFRFLRLRFICFFFLLGHFSVTTAGIPSPDGDKCTSSGMSGELSQCFEERETAAGWGWANYPRNSEYSYYGPLYDGAGATGWWWAANYTPTGGQMTGPWRIQPIQPLVCGDAAAWFNSYNGGRGGCAPAGEIPRDTIENPKDLGTSCDDACGEPIKPGTGNMWHIERDLIPANARATAITRTYNSSPFYSIDKYKQLFGVRWTTPFDARIVRIPGASSGTPSVRCWRRLDIEFMWCQYPSLNSVLPLSVSISRGDGKRFIFNREGFNWFGDTDNKHQLVATYNADQTDVVAWTFTSANDASVERFDGAGTLLSITALTGTVQRFTYSNGVTNDTNVGRLPIEAPACANVQAGPTMGAGRLLCVTDSDGRQVQFEYDAKGRVSKTLDPALQETSYAYDGPTGGCTTSPTYNAACAANNLVKGKREFRPTFQS